MIRPRFTLIAVLALATAGCGSALAPSATPTPTPTQSLLPGASGDPFAGQPYSIDLPANWTTFNISDPASAATLAAFVKVNPALAAPIARAEALPNIRLAADSHEDRLLVLVPFAAFGLPLATLGRGFSTQYAALPGMASPAPPQRSVLPGGAALHWLLRVTSNGVGGGTMTAQESVYLFDDARTGVIVEFVQLGDALDPDESSIVETFNFTP